MLRRERKTTWCFSTLGPEGNGAEPCSHWLRFLCQWRQPESKIWAQPSGVPIRSSQYTGDASVTSPLCLPLKEKRGKISVLPDNMRVHQNSGHHGCTGKFITLAQSNEAESSFTQLIWLRKWNLEVIIMLKSVLTIMVL